MAGRDCSELISLRAPIADAPAVDTPQAAATRMWFWARASEASLEPTPLHAKPSPAPIIVTVVIERPRKRSA